jgi:hypothetical protein
MGAADLIADHCAPFQCSMRPRNPRVFPTAMHIVDDGHDTLERLSWGALAAPAQGASAAVSPDIERRTTVKPEIRRPLRTCLRDRWLLVGVHAHDLRSIPPPRARGDTVCDGPRSEGMIHARSDAHSGRTDRCCPMRDGPRDPVLWPAAPGGITRLRIRPTTSNHRIAYPFRGSLGR